MRRDSWTQTQRSWLQTGFPFTIALMVLKFLSLFLLTDTPVSGLFGQLYFIAPESLYHPWTLLTYSVLSSVPVVSFFSFLFDVGLTYWFCGSLERAWGTKTFSIFFLGVTLTSSVALTIGSLLFHRPIAADDLLPVAAAGLAWGVLNAEEQVQLYFIPMRGIHVGAIAVCYIMFEFARDASWLAVPFALVGCGFAYLWVRNGWQYGMGTLLPNVTQRVPKRPNLRLVDAKPRPRDDRFTPKDLSPLRWLAKRNEKKKFERLMKDD